MLKLDLQYFDHLMQRTDSLEKTLMLGKIEGLTKDNMVGWYHWLDGHELSKLWELVMDREGWRVQSVGCQIVRHNLVTELNIMGNMMCQENPRSDAGSGGNSPLWKGLKTYLSSPLV